MFFPQNPPHVEKFAAGELARYLNLSLGWKTETKKAPARGDWPVFWVENYDPKRLGIAGFKLGVHKQKADGLTDDGICIKGDGKNVVLTGKGPRGALHAVYSFLEQIVGCHWPEPGEDYVPKLKTLKLDGLELINNPAFRYRGIAIHGTCGPEYFVKIIDWEAKNHLNAFQLFPGHYEQLRPQVLGEITKRGLYPNIGGHSREFFFPSAKYFSKHPEWFALVKGKRVADTQICYSNMDSVSEYSANIVSYLRTRPEIEMVGLWPSDGFGFCECEKCKTAHKTDLLLNYINKLSKEVNAVFPKIKCEFLSYIDYTAPPKDIKPLPNVVPTYCEYWSRSQFHPVTEEWNDNKRCRMELDEWISRSAETTLFSYYGDDCIKRFLYNPIEDVIVQDLRHYEKTGLSGHFVLLTNPESWWSNAPHIYAFARAAWDRTISVDAIRKDYYASLYGPASGAMTAHAKACWELFYSKMAQGVTGERVLFNRSISGFDPTKDEKAREQARQIVARMKKALDDARALKPRPYTLARIAKLESASDYLGLLFETVCQVHLTERDNTATNRERLRVLAKQALNTEVMTQDDAKGYRTGSGAVTELMHRFDPQR